MRKVELGKTGEQISVLGQGTWGIKSRKGKKYYDSWKESLRTGIELVFPEVIGYYRQFKS